MFPHLKSETFMFYNKKCQEDFVWYHVSFLISTSTKKSLQTAKRSVHNSESHSHIFPTLLRAGSCQMSNLNVSKTASQLYPSHRQKRQTTQHIEMYRFKTIEILFWGPLVHLFFVTITVLNISQQEAKISLVYIWQHLLIETGAVVEIIVMTKTDIIIAITTCLTMVYSITSGRKVFCIKISGKCVDTYVSTLSRHFSFFLRNWSTKDLFNTYTEK